MKKRMMTKQAIIKTEIGCVTTACNTMMGDIKNRLKVYQDATNLNKIDVQDVNKAYTDLMDICVFLGIEK